MAEVYPNDYVDSIVRERNRYRDALRHICDSTKCPWTAVAMFNVANTALNAGSQKQREAK